LRVEQGRREKAEILDSWQKCVFLLLKLIANKEEENNKT
jgi:hypothetical protein